MSSGFAILVDGTAVPEFVDLATTVKIEQSLDDSARYTLRLDADLDDDGDFPLFVDDRLRPGAELAFLVGDGDKSACLVQGPIDRVRVHIENGGAGSWIEVMGGDRRVVMDRLHHTVAWEQTDGDIVTKLLKDYGLAAEVADTKHTNSQDSHTQNQSATDLAWIQRLARRNGCHFWISYDVSYDRFAGYTITEQGNFKPSPPRSDLTPPGLGALADLLPGGDPPRLALNLADHSLQTISAIDIEYDVERPTMLSGTRVHEATNATDDATVPDPPHDPLGAVTLKGLTGVDRSLFLTTAGDPDELHTRATAALAEAEWFARATVRCSAYALGDRVLQPHMIVRVVGVGTRFTGDWFVTTVTHTLEPKNHWMDVELARNAFGA